MSLILVRYGELALKSRPVRLRFERRLLGNIEDMFLREKQECLPSREWGRLTVHVKDDARAGQILGRVFGITSFSPVVECGSGKEEIAVKAVELASGWLAEGTSFAVRARRSGQHPYTSQELAAFVGRAVLCSGAGKGVRVDLTSPRFELFIEVRQDRAFLFAEKFPGPGGLPMGTQGRVVAFLDGERAAAAAWLLMKRGCRVIAVDAREGAGAGGAAGPEAGKIAPARREGTAEHFPALELLLPWAPDLRLHAGVSLEGLVAFARRKKAEGLVLGRTYPELDGGIRWAELPVFYPLCGLSDAEVESLIDRMRQARTDRANIKGLKAD